VVKPAGLATMGVAPDKPSLLELARQYVKHRCRKPGNVYLGVMSRLDAPVTGIVLLARTSKAAGRLTEQFRSHRVRKTYWTVVEGTVQPAAGQCLDWLGHDERHRRMHVVGPMFPGAKQARLTYRRLKSFSGLSLLEVELQTGRKHQIRLQLSSRGWPVLGDRKYGSRRPFPAGIALHARQLVITHPIKGEPLEFQAPLPSSWQRLGLDE
jgi:23S rRNA pseudouridine1911/1915/1917 synthase